MLLIGVHVPLATPFYPDGRLYVRKLEHNVRRYSLTPVSGLIALGSNSEIASLSSQERFQVLETVGKEAAKDKVLTAGIGLPSVNESIALAKEAAATRFDLALLSAPLEYSSLLWQENTPQSAAWTYFEAIADASPLPVVLHSSADRPALPTKLIQRLAEHPNVVGLLDESGQVERIAQIRELTAQVKRTVTTTITFTAATGRMLIAEEPTTVVGGSFVDAATLSGGAAVATAPPVPALKTRSKDVGFQLVWGVTKDAGKALGSDTQAVAMPLAASVPQAAYEVWAAWKDGDPRLLENKQQRLYEAEKGIALWDIPAVKYASELSGYFGGRPRLPLLPVTAERAEEITRLLNGMHA